MTSFNYIYIRFFRETTTSASGYKTKWVGIFFRVGWFFNFRVAVATSVNKVSAVKNGV